jgi:hypothetical protein
MPIDATGTKPGLQPQAQEPQRHNMRCRNKGCDSMEVFEIPMPSNTGRHVYQCVKCHTTWGVTTGGCVDLG